MRLESIVEGHGEVSSLPILVRSIIASISPGTPLQMGRPIRVKRQRILKEGELEKAVELAARHSGPGGHVLILLDADEDCPKELAPRILARARAARSDREIHVVLAVSEFESWFLAALSSLAGQRGIRPDAVAPTDPEGIRDAKAWLARQMLSGSTYSETVDQPALTALLDLQAARTSRSFDKLWREVRACLSAGGTDSR